MLQWDSLWLNKIVVEALNCVWCIIFSSSNMNSIILSNIIGSYAHRSWLITVPCMLSLHTYRLESSCCTAQSTGCTGGGRVEKWLSTLGFDLNLPEMVSAFVIRSSKVAFSSWSSEKMIMHNSMLGEWLNPTIFNRKSPTTCTFEHWHNCTVAQRGHCTSVNKSCNSHDLKWWSCTYNTIGLYFIFGLLLMLITASKYHDR